MNYSEASLKGVREQNEDAHVIIQNLDYTNCNINNVNMYGIFDGHGGKEVSNYVANIIPKYFFDKSVDYPLSKNYVIQVYDSIQESLKKHSFSQYSGSTGLVLIHFKHKNQYKINVMNNGDCRAIICRDNFAMPLTKDHKPSWPEERHRITQLGGKLQFDGFDWRIKDLSVSRSFGDTDAAPFVSYRPELFRYTLDPKSDKFIVMGCDGLFDVLSNTEIVNFILLNCYDPSTTKRVKNCSQISKKLAEYAIHNKRSTDNVSVIVIFLD